MNLQIIKSNDGRPEYVLLPIAVYAALRTQINKEFDKAKNEDYVDFDVSDYVDNPVALARIKAHVTQKELAAAMGVTQAYISKLENQTTVSAKVLNNIHNALAKIHHK